MASWARVGDENAITTLHQALIDDLKRSGHLHTTAAEAAFRAIPRHLFLPGVALDLVYSDEAIPTKYLDGVAVSASSQPGIMAVLLEQLELAPGQHVLEIGAGTGYNAALIAHIIGDLGHVVTIDIDEDIVEDARNHLTSAGFDQVKVIYGDGGLGYPADAPYDRIILTVGACDITPAWREQLTRGGRILLPLSIRGVERVIVFESAGDHLVSTWITRGDAVRLRGAMAGSEMRVQLGSEPGLHIEVDDPSLIDGGTVYRLLTGPSRGYSTKLRLTQDEIDGLRLWLALHEPGYCTLMAEGAWADRGIVPCLTMYSGIWPSCSTDGLLDPASMCVLMRAPDQAPAVNDPLALTPFELFVRSYGSDDTLAHRLITQATAWDFANRPSDDGLRIRAYPLESNYIPSATEKSLTKQWTRLVVDWT
jgi:protein-L-isoaspartate(D-aspartate) O-methyltransferase